MIYEILGRRSLKRVHKNRIREDAYAWEANKSDEEEKEEGEKKKTGEKKEEEEKKEK